MFLCALPNNQLLRHIFELFHCIKFIDAQQVGGRFNWTIVGKQIDSHPSITSMYIFFNILYCQVSKQTHGVICASLSLSSHSSHITDEPRLEKPSAGDSIYRRATLVPSFPSPPPLITARSSSSANIPKPKHNPRHSSIKGRAGNRAPLLECW